MLHRTYLSFCYPIVWLAAGFSGCLTLKPLMAQTLSGAQRSVVAQTSPQSTPPRINQPPSLQPLPPPPTPEPPPPLNNLRLPPPSLPVKITPGATKLVEVTGFKIEGSKVFTQKQIDEATKGFYSKDPLHKKYLSLAELFQAADAITKYYVDHGYITTGAYIPADRTIEDGVVPVKVVEGSIAADHIRIRFKEKTRHRLRPNYVRSRIALATQKPLNKQRLLEALQLLKLNPLIQDIKAELSEGTDPGQSFLDVEVTEAKTFGVQVVLDNEQLPIVGTFRRQLQMREANLTGLGDGLALAYSNTDGSNEGTLSYTLPVNPHNGTVSFNFGIAASKIVQAPFDVLNVRSNSRYFELTFRQPIVQTPTQEFALGVTASRQYSKATLVDGEIPFPVTGSDFEGKTRVNTLRFFQEWTQRRERSVLAARSQFSFGLNIFDATTLEKPPDGRYFSWRGQAQLARLLAPDTLLLLRGNIQVANQALVPLEQFGLGGVQSVRGYRQDALLSDNGLFLSAEVDIPILRAPKSASLLQVAPFVDFGTAWNLSGLPDPAPTTLASVGLGLKFQAIDRLNARFDWGIPLIAIRRDSNTLQERGFYFSLTYNFF